MEIRKEKYHNAVSTVGDINIVKPQLMQTQDGACMSHDSTSLNEGEIFQAKFVNKTKVLLIHCSLKFNPFNVGGKAI
ncbi:hypothetical protein HI914_05192 [Erysiphe necator]|nr:hypothetical protein HI914_05192 [Erysiphe necator]